MDKKGYFAGAVNFGIKQCDTDILILNQDVHLEGTDWIELIEKNKSQYALIGERIRGRNPSWTEGYIHGTFMFIRRDVFKSIGYFNSTEYPLWGCTAEFQLRACRKGFKPLMVEDVPGFIHLREGPYGESIQEILVREPEKKSLFLKVPPEISVVIPAYNHGKYLPDLVNSLIGGKTCLGMSNGQTYQSFEVVIADDASTDNTEEICRKLHNPLTGVRYVKCPYNGGTAFATNFGIKNSTGRVVTTISADDMRESTSLDRMYNELIRHPDEKVFVYDDMQILLNGKLNPKIWRMEDFNPKKLLYKNHIHFGIMFLYQAWKEAKGYPEAMKYGREDWAFNIALMVAGYKGIHVSHPGYYYRREGQNRTLHNTTPDWRDKFCFQLADIFPSLYTQEVINMCCGKSNAPKPRNAPGKSQAMVMNAKALAGSVGSVLLEYVGGNYGNQTFYGPVTGTGYIFSLSRKLGNVDVRDLRSERKLGLLDRIENGKNLFKQVVAAPKKEEPAPIPVPAPVPDPLPVPMTIGQATIISMPMVSTPTTFKKAVEVPVLPHEVEEFPETLPAGKTILDESNVSKDILQHIYDAGYTTKEAFISELESSLKEHLGWGVGKIRSIKNVLKGNK
jgi:glycosyltransferase involved in cell wall biosynthesis